MTRTSTGAATLQALCDEGIALQGAGRLEEAARLYRRVLDRDPQHFNGLCLLAVVCLELGRAEAAAALIRQAIASGGAPGEGALAAAYNNLGNAFLALGRPDEALASYDYAIGLQPGNGRFRANRGRLLFKQDRLMEALEAYEAALGLNPVDAEIHFGKGATLQAMQRDEEALASYAAAVALRPRFAQALHNQAVIFSKLGLWDAVLATCERALAIDPGRAEALARRGLALFGLARFEEALASLDAALALGLRSAEGYSNHGATLYALHRPEAALESYDQAVRLQADDPQAQLGRGAALQALGRFAEALACFERAIAASPKHAEAHAQRGMTLLRMGRFAEGWREYEWRHAGWRLAAPFRPERRWLGEEPLGGRTLFVQHEQGLGDTIQFVRYVQALRDQGARVALSVQDPLKRLLQASDPGLKVLGQDEYLLDFDLYCPLLSLPLALGATAETIPAPGRYLAPDRERRAWFEAKLGPRTRPRIGLAWSGSPGHDNDHARSIRFAELAPWLSPAFQWVCLQDQVRPEDRAALKASTVGFHGADLGDFADTAALADLMDLVVSVDTSIAHLAGALGKPVWILLPLNSDWRWFTDQDDSPWYANARLFRQERRGDWPGVLEAVGQALDAWARDRAGPPNNGDRR